MGSNNTFRKSRFHDEKGNLVDCAGLLYLPLAVGGALLRVFFNYRPTKPTISFRATGAIDKILQPHYKCVEFGSGMSTVWLAERCQFLLSRENNNVWYDKIKTYLQRRGYSHVQYEYCAGDKFACLDDFDCEYFDFALIDGWDRAGCVSSVLSRIKRGGWLYLDNSDKDMQNPNGDMRRAEKLVIEYSKKHGTEIKYFVDFSRTNFFVEQGLLLQI